MAKSIIGADHPAQARGAAKTRKTKATIPRIGLALVPSSPWPPCAETVKVTRRLYELALEGRLVGLAFGMASTNSEYWVDAVGVLERDPTLARGIVAALDDELASRVAL